ncbi:D-alanine--D-alanine ligase [Pantoea sp. Nvir]|uniref:D-alanine--D-alanine ligase n=1 Tax=Pantoea sp. Nvir TaxID=2576760 RepID=UPI001357B5C1|nr:D-alanine--D-alanine ligase [Pantoea sp. Nvir]MXP66790.1 D-alanine--D-alanine ligase [Pantoea sp. Nvir]CAJ0990829.1 D-alanine--D-alanine ligase A [Pantoea sp. Nvir]
MTKLRVGIVFGGKSVEHEVSLQSAKNILAAIDKTRFEPVLLGIDKQGKWHLNNSSNFLANAKNPTLIALNYSGEILALVPGDTQNQVIARYNGRPLAQLDVIFPVAHGTFGEDGSLQGLLRMTTLPFVGSGVLSSAVSMDKHFTKCLLRDAGLQLAPWISVTKKKRSLIKAYEVIAHLGLPLFIKPANQGSSVGISKVDKLEAFEHALDLAFTFDHKVLIEKCITGREIECAILGNDEPYASPCGEVIVHDTFYNYETKYISKTGAKIQVPAVIDSQTSDLIRTIAIKAFQKLECSGMARVDFFLTEANKIFVNEINTLPGFTDISMYPKLWEAGGISCCNLITRLIELALESHQQKMQLKSSI